MEKERKFKFVGSEKEWITLTNGQVFSAGYIIMNGRTVLEYKDLYPEDWEEVTEPETTRIPNQDQPASSMTKFEMAVFMAMQGLLSNPNTAHQITSALGSNVSVEMADRALVGKAITLAKETFKQLNKCQE